VEIKCDVLFIRALRVKYGFVECVNNEGRYQQSAMLCSNLSSDHCDEFMSSNYRSLLKNTHGRGVVIWSKVVGVFSNTWNREVENCNQISIGVGVFQETTVELTLRPLQKYSMSAALTPQFKPDLRQKDCSKLTHFL